MISCLLPRPLTKQPFHNGDYPKGNEYAPKEANSFLQELASLRRVVKLEMADLLFVQVPVHLKA